MITQIINCQANTKNLNLGDSLFKTQNYKEALEIYENLLHEEQSYTPSMLLKMAFITEGMGDYPKTTLYLSKYYDYNPNQRITNKIKALTEQTNLVGYTVSDGEQFFRLLADQREKITIFLILCLLLSLGFIIKFKERADKPRYFVPSIILILLIFFSNNFLHTPQRAIITGSPTLIMDQPTAGGNLIKKVDAGHRVKVNSTKDIWYEIEWENRKGYVKKNSLTKL
ncbi:SH3 domain-containing protein [Anditalea andensis]|nr:SH3 domain-containing protein [Anditalea andensis]